MDSDFRSERAADEVRAMVEAGRVSHTRAGSGCWRDVIHVYGRDDASPSGFGLIGATCEQHAERAGLRGGLSPLSPTEAR